MDNMSTTLLMTDSWQPTVLQLMPFSSNNAAPLDHGRARGYSQVRGFPTLAVTRTRGKGSSKPMRISSERLSRVGLNGRTPQPPRAKSEYTSRAQRNLITTESTYFMGPEDKTQSESQDSSETLSVTEIPRNMKLLPKPSPCRSVDGRYFLPQHGFRRSATMTPGEMELQKHRTKLLTEEGIGNKYKFNINQLPRSTTPINDNDPDKLNIKQVIRFLQSKESEPIEMAEANIKKPDRRVKSDCPTSVSPTVSVRTSVEKEKTDVSFPPMLPFRREVTMFASSPSSKKRGKTSTRSCERISKSTDGHSSSFKTTREFRLHRFLTMAPNSDEFSEVRQSQSRSPKPTSAAQRRLLITEYFRGSNNETESVRNNGSPAPSNPHSRQGERYVKLQYRLPNKRSEILTVHNQISKGTRQQRPVQADSVQGVIRLPSMSDFKNDSDTEDTKEEAWRGEYRNLRTSSVSVENSHGDSHGRESVSTSSTKDVESDSCFKPASRRVTISLPKEAASDYEDRRRHDLDPVRLSLRHENALTREKTYMSDIAKPRSGEQWPGALVSGVLFSNNRVKHKDGTTVVKF